MTTSQVLMIVFAILTVLGVGMIALGLRTIRMSAATLKWPAATGRIILSEVKEDWDLQSSDSPGGAIQYNTYHPVVNYEYTVDGTGYIGNRIYFINPGKGKESEARKILNEYPLGKEVKVSYDPAKPGDSVLVASVSPAGRILVIIGNIIGLIGLVGLAVDFYLNR